MRLEQAFPTSGAAFLLPALPTQAAVLYSNLTDRRSRNALQTLAAAFKAGAG